jgi:hypothetical protein
MRIIDCKRWWYMTPPETYVWRHNRVGWWLATTICKTTGKVSKLQPFWWKHFSRWNRPQVLRWGLNCSIYLRLHPTTGDSQRVRMVPAKYLRNMMQVLGLRDPLVGSHRGSHSHHRYAGKLTAWHLTSQLKSTTTTTTWIQQNDPTEIIFRYAWLALLCPAIYIISGLLQYSLTAWTFS